MHDRFSFNYGQMADKDSKTNGVSIALLEEPIFCRLVRWKGSIGVYVMSDIRIVMVNTSHPGNIGAAARAMKNMGLSQLYLVNPITFPDQRATLRAAGADDILQSAKVVDSIKEAVAGCELVFATSARER